MDDGPRSDDGDCVVKAIGGGLRDAGGVFEVGTRLSGLRPE